MGIDCRLRQGRDLGRVVHEVSSTGSTKDGKAARRTAYVHAGAEYMYVGRGANCTVVKVRLEMPKDPPEEWI